MHVVRVTLQHRLDTCAESGPVWTSPGAGRLTLQTTNLEDSVFQVQDVDVVVSRADNQTVVLSQRDHRSHDAGTRTEVSPTHELTLELRTMELISGISRLDLKQDQSAVLANRRLEPRTVSHL